MSDRSSHSQHPGSSSSRPRGDDTAARLRSLADRMESFVLSQLERLELIADRCRDVLSEESQVRAKLNALQHSQEEWESGRRSESERLKDEALRLEAAWSLLEAEQRRLLMMQGASAALITATARPVMPAELAESSGNADPARLAGGRERLAATADSHSQESAQLQFQQLRREVQRHSRP